VIHNFKSNLNFVIVSFQAYATNSTAIMWILRILLMVTMQIDAKCFYLSSPKGM